MERYISKLFDIWMALQSIIGVFLFWNLFKVFSESVWKGSWIARTVGIPLLIFPSSFPTNLNLPPPQIVADNRWRSHVWISTWSFEDGKKNCKSCPFLCMFSVATVSPCQERRRKKKGGNWHLLGPEKKKRRRRKKNGV